MSRYAAWALSFLAGFLLMVLELTASRLMAPIMGTSLYTWTAVIGVVLCGLSFGAYLGGVVIDRRPTLKTLGYTFFIGGLSITILYLLTPGAFILATLPIDIPLLATSVAALLFFVPSLLLGMIQPMIVRLSTDQLLSIGKTYGLLSAFWSLGSIAGVFLTGYMLIPRIGSLKTLILISVLLVFCGGCILRFARGRGKMIGTTLTLLLLFSMWATATIDYGHNVLFAKDTGYYSVAVADVDIPEYGPSRIFFLDIDTHSIERTKKGEPLYTDSARLFAQSLSLTSSVAVIGAGAYTVPNDLARYSSSSVLVIEIDPEVPGIAQRYFPVDRNVHTQIGDARIFFRRSKDSYDFIFGDAFSSSVSVPWHLLTKEFDTSIAEHLSSHGVYVVNIISAVKGDKNDLYRAVDETLRSVFPYVESYAFGTDLTGPQNIVFASSYSPLDPLVEKGSTTEVVLGARETFEHMRVTEKHEKGIILTDDYAPTEMLLAPVTRLTLSSSIALHSAVLGLFESNE